MKYTDIEKKKISTHELKRLSTIDGTICRFTECSIYGLVKQFAPLQKSISPLVDKLQVHLDMFPEKKKDECKIVEQGFLNYNLCLNVQTSKKHTECDASYTLITVPVQLSQKKILQTKNKGKFELNINEDDTLIIPMDAGTGNYLSGRLIF